MESILITNHHLKHFMGSEINALELALTFRKKGMKVYVATLVKGDPIASEFLHYDIPVIDLLNSEKIDNMVFDLGWIHHLPVFYMALSKGIRFKKVLFSCLSFFEPLETPPLNISEFDVVCFNSQETYNKLTCDGFVPTHCNYIINPNAVLPDFFSQYKKNHSKTLQKLLVVSNHIPEEILELGNHFEKIDFYGIEGTVKNSMITPNILLQYDAVISIGKTAQYALCVKVPVYCYDIFGGSGWVTSKNYTTMEEYNYSGRDSCRKIPTSEIAHELKTFYNDAVFDVDFLYEYGKEKYNFDKLVERTLNAIEPKYNFLEKLSNTTKTLIKYNEYYTRQLKHGLSLESLFYKKEPFFLKAALKKILRKLF